MDSLSFHRPHTCWQRHTYRGKVLLRWMSYCLGRSRSGLQPKQPSGRRIQTIGNVAHPQNRQETTRDGMLTTFQPSLSRPTQTRRPQSQSPSPLVVCRSSRGLGSVLTCLRKAIGSTGKRRRRLARSSAATSRGPMLVLKWHGCLYRIGLHQYLRFLAQMRHHSVRKAHLGTTL